MKKLSVYMLTATAGAALGACSQKPSGIDSAQGAPSGRAQTAVAQGDLPRIKEGLWAATVSIENPYGASIRGRPRRLARAARRSCWRRPAATAPR